MYSIDDDEDDDDLGQDVSYHEDDTLRDIRPLTPASAPILHRASIIPEPSHAIATPKLSLLFAIASDDVAQVRQVLESGEAGPNDQVGPQSALAFTLTNDRLQHKMEIVKALLAYGADPSALQNPELNPPHRQSMSGSLVPSTPVSTLREGMDPATRYYVNRADKPGTRRTSQLIHRSFFRPLTRVQYDLIGQDCAIEQLFRVLSMHSQQLAVAPIVVLLCGPSGHGKSLLARKFGALLDVPTHTVNMPTLRSTHDLWQSYSMNPYEEPSSHTLAQFLLQNEGKRCVVVLDEIEKTEDEKALWSLLMPWELGRCSPEAGKRHIDVRNVIWLGTSNIGHDLVFDHNEARPDPHAPITRPEYLELTGLLRPKVSSRLGASLLSRVTTVLPFVPFSKDEKKAVAAEALYTLGGDLAQGMSPQEVEIFIDRALPSYLPQEGARSLYRAVSSLLVDHV
ncbi:P-loop containing nucleoside triphosphate hydrolase protein [Athelia psychrophila]|uniref:P-loop containing nucleoside triphosphate hydrolase protein n=1 Tax=Athelia psychrophila TaxID=1759441 RepID=A0A165XNB5_9AGAM|nr:P-loop containing nucleoside triphosphate hydrolase protein [Fibularhizoctonia sp. CBS 109695]